MARQPRKTDAPDMIESADTAPEVVVVAEEPTLVPIGNTLPHTAEEQMAGQIAIMSAEERLNAEIEAGKRAVEVAQARVAPAAE